MPANVPAPLQERNLLIEASAGSGKTHHLVGRFLRLLLAFKKPDQIIALTFTRKAAGEFFDRILGALADAATSPAGAQKAARDFQVDGLNQGTARELLRLATDSLHRLSLGTLDSFYSRVLRSFPAEFGISGDFEILDEGAEAAARQSVLDSILADVGDADAFLAAFRQATFGAEEKQLLSNLEKFISSYHRLLIACPDRERWTTPRAIWPKAPWWMVEKFDLDSIAEVLRKAAISASAQHKSAGKGFEKLAEELPLFSGGATGQSIGGILEKALDLFEDLHAGRVAELQYYKLLELDRATTRALADAVGFVLQQEIISKLQQTAGIYDIVWRYESLYHRDVRRAGRLSFDDILILLAGAAPDDDANRETVSELSMLDEIPDAETRRLRIDYRLDGLFHHWLIDEFQDTSRRQWQVLRNLIEEVIEDDSGERTFYYVGDEKQAIYGWRGGDSRLFQEIRNRYNQPPRPEDRWIAEDHLDVSWRSGPVLLDAVNTAFGNWQNLATLLGEDHAPVIRDRWKNTNAGDHAASPLTENRPGFFQYLTVEENESEDAELTGQNAVWQAVLETLREIDPVGNSLSVAVLMRRGKQAAHLADFVRQDGQIPVMVEGKMPVGTDHPIATSFRALLKFAAHPGDTAAWEHLAMTPALSSLDYEALGKARYELPRETLDLLHDRGFGAVFEQWSQKLATALDDSLDAFSLRRIDQLSEACRRFDLKGSRSINEFLHFLDSYTAADTPSAGVVQIMTIHKAKGLTFDAVILADLKPDAITSLREMDAIKGFNDQRQLEWVITAPRKELAKAVEPLRSGYLEAEMDTALEELCAMYVALTRARYANHVILPKLPSKKDSTASAVLLARQFEAAGFEPREESIGEIPVTVRYEAGDANWIELIEQKEPEKKSETPATRAPVTATRRFPLRRRRIPSNASDRRSWGGVANLFVPESASATGFGSAVHALFESIEWLAEDVERNWDSLLLPFPEHAKEAREQTRKSLAEKSIRSRFTSSHYRSPLVWREKRFEMITPNGEWISGVFDRVVLERDTSGEFLTGHIIDFKTNRVSSEEEIEKAVAHYTPQMTVYRAALSRLTGLPEAAIRAELIFTRPRVVRTVFSTG